MVTIEMSRMHSSIAIGLMLACGGCAPMLQLGGAYFPAWLLSAVCGLLLVSVVRLLLIKLGVDREVRPRALAYPAMTVVFTLAIYLIFFP